MKGKGITCPHLASLYPIITRVPPSLPSSLAYKTRTNLTVYRGADIHCVSYMNHPRPCTTFLAILIVFHAFLMQCLAEECPLDTKIPTSWNVSETSDGSWGGFLSSKGCGEPFARYLYTLGKKANQTGETFLNITEQKECSNAMEMDLYGCGIDRLTSGTGGCSDYSVTDVENKLGADLEGLRKHCENTSSNAKFDQECDYCLRRWHHVNGSANNTNDLSGEDGYEICRFSVLVSLTSQRIMDVGWIQSLYTCLASAIPEDDNAKEGKKANWVLLGGEFLAGGVAGMSVLSACIFCVWFKRTKKKQPQKEKHIVYDDSHFEKSSSITISLKDVYLATDNLSELNFIGQGIAGKVYKGMLSDGKRVAVKHIMNDGHMETFVREITSLSHIKHPNLVALLGHCDGEDESFIVYELCDNGNLSEWLFGKQKFLTWIQRLEIAIDCARGLWFLHTYPEGCIVHRDIKPTNILLGADFQAKLSDFGLSKVIGTGVSFVSSEVRGTFGYVDPEYQQNRRVHPATDVYSFGIVLLQLVSGQRVVNLDVTKPMPLSKMAKNIKRGGEITEFADAKLDGEYPAEAFQLVFRLALSCTGLKQQRPSMEKVVAVLEKAHRISESMMKSLDHSFQSM